MIEELKSKAKELLKSKQLDLIIGYKRASDGISAMPFFAEREEDIDSLIWDGHCRYNLSSYLKDFPKKKKKGIVAKPCDIRAIVVLMQENQLKREDLFIIGLECRGMIDEKRLFAGDNQTPEIDFEAKCRSCESHTPLIFDLLIKDKGLKAKEAGGEGQYDYIRKLEAKSAQEKLKFWQEEFSRCIRCYACRQVCPLCYCPRCVADQAMPAWFSKKADLKGNFSWNVTRAMHLAGRCIDCGECERACPAGIPLRDINKKIEKDVLELFKYTPGAQIDQKPLFASFDKSDPEQFIR